jgi:hypothetical protein
MALQSVVFTQSPQYLFMQMVCLGGVLLTFVGAASFLLTRRRVVRITGGLFWLKDPGANVCEVGKMGSGGKSFSKEDESEKEACANRPLSKFGIIGGGDMNR